MFFENKAFKNLLIRTQETSITLHTMDSYNFKIPQLLWLQLCANNFSDSKFKQTISLIDNDSSV
jgi:hypothetical protein